MKPAWLVPGALLLVAIFAWRAHGRERGPVTPRRAPASSAAATTDARRAIARLTSQIVVSEQQAEARPRSAAPLTRLSAFHVARAKLTGHYADYEAAEDALARACDRAGPAGPHMARARLAFTLHRLGDAHRSLELAAPGLDVNYHRAKVDSLRGELALAEGDYDRAEHFLVSSERAHPTAASAFRLGLLAEQRGRFDAADGHYARALDRTPRSAKQARASTWRRRGLLALKRGRYDEAEAHYARADALFGGDFRTEMRRAELLALRGRTQEALGRLRALAERTDEPELMDALSEIYRGLGSHAAAERWYARAQRRYDERMERLPEATLGHALRHALMGPDPMRALALARRNVTLRPGGEERLLLAQASARAGELLEALAALRGARELGYRSAELFATEAVVRDALGLPSARAHADARALRPDALDQVAWLVHELPAPPR